MCEKVLRDLYRLQRNGILKFTLQTPAIAVQIKSCDWFQPIRASVSQQADDATASGGSGVSSGVLTIEKLSMLVYYLLYGAERCSQSKVNPFRYIVTHFITIHFDIVTLYRILYTLIIHIHTLIHIYNVAR
jgi:hypothetical protein